MMDRIKVAGLTLIAVIALGALNASAASATRSLVLEEEAGGPLAPGAVVGFYVEFTEAECVIEGYAYTAVNSAHKDLLNNPFSLAYCEDEQVPSGIQSIQLDSAGNGKLLASAGTPIRLEPALEGCVYEFKKLSGFFASPGQIRINGEARGKLSRTLTTSKGCEPKLATGFTAVLEIDSEIGH
jgi:hypothetical protein